jgi:hypothetical protein
MEGFEDDIFKVKLELFRDREEFDDVENERLREDDFEVKLEPDPEGDFEVKLKPHSRVELDDDDIGDVEGRVVGPIEACLIGAGCGLVLSEIVGTIVFGASIGLGRHNHNRAHDLPDGYGIMVVICMVIGVAIGYVVNRVINGKDEWVHEEEDDEYDKLWK